MRVLVLDDRYESLDAICYRLRSEGFEVQSCPTIFMADAIIEEFGTEAIVTDLSMRPEGLEEDHITRTHGSLLTGYIWFKEHVIRNNAEDDYIRRTTFFSEYLEIANDIIIEHNENIELFRSIHQIGKAGNGLALLVQHLNRLQREVL